MAFARLDERKMLKSCALTRQRESIIKIACCQHIWESLSHTHTHAQYIHMHTHTPKTVDTLKQAAVAVAVEEEEVEGKRKQRKSVNENPFGRIFQLIYFWLISFVCYFSVATWYNPSQSQFRTQPAFIAL